MAVPLRYNFRSLFYRKTASILTIIAIALTVSILVIILAVARGFEKSMTKTGRDDNLICLRNGSTSEGESTLTREDANVLKGLPGIARSEDGRVLAAAELYAGIALDREDGGTTNVPLRGIAPESFLIRSNVKLAQGEAPRPGAREVVVGSALVGRIRGCRLGGAVRISKDLWQVVGVIEAGGTAYDSEVWGDAELLLQIFDRTFYNGLILQVAPSVDQGRPAEYVTTENRRELVSAPSGMMAHIEERLGSIKASTERQYFSDQAGVLGEMLKRMALFLTGLMGLGALAGCTNTLLAAVAGRTREIGGLLAIGFRPWHVFVGFLLEALALSIVGGGLGLLVTAPLHGLKTGTTNWQTFTEQAFSFDIDAVVVASALGLTFLVGIIGGVLPAWRASRLKPVDALRRG